LKRRVTGPGKGGERLVWREGGKFGSMSIRKKGTKDETERGRVGNNGKKRKSEGADPTGKSRSI